jgi:hypothetical protein
MQWSLQRRGNMKRRTKKIKQETKKCETTLIFCFSKFQSSVPAMFKSSALFENKKKWQFNKTLLRKYFWLFSA